MHKILILFFVSVLGFSAKADNLSQVRENFSHVKKAPVKELTPLSHF